MKLSQHIAELQRLYAQHGDLELGVFKDNALKEVSGCIAVKSYEEDGQLNYTENTQGSPDYVVVLTKN